MVVVGHSRRCYRRRRMPVKASPLTIHERMRRVRQRDTAPELCVRQLLASNGIRYRVCPEGIPGRPDLINRSAGWALFVHGCFWHGHRNCALATVPKTNCTFWTQKIDANRARDKRKERELRRLGLRVYTVWQCQLNDDRFLARLVTRLKEGR